MLLLDLIVVRAVLADRVRAAAAADDAAGADLTSDLVTAGAATNAVTADIDALLKKKTISRNVLIRVT